MSTQIAVRLPEELVRFLDELVAEGAPSRATIVARALDDHRRRLRAERDAAILAESGDYDDFDGLVAHAVVDVD